MAGSVIVRGYGFRRTGTVNRPVIKLVNETEVDIEHRAITQALLVMQSIFEIDFEFFGDPGLEVEFRDLLSIDTEARKVTTDGE